MALEANNGLNKQRQVQASQVP